MCRWHMFSTDRSGAEKWECVARNNPWASYLLYRKKYPAHTNLAKNKKEVNSMSDISELDLQNLRHLIGGFDTTRCKMQEYAKEAEDPKVKQFFEKGARNAMENKQQLMKFLQ